MDFVSDQDANGIGRYGHPTVALHWVVALTLIVAVVLGLTLGNTPEEASNRKDLFDWHRWVGVTVFALVLVRIVVRAFNRAPPPLASISSFQQWVAHFTHGSLYVLMVAAPLTGYLLSNRMGEAIVLFGSINLPPLLVGGCTEFCVNGQSTAGASRPVRKHNEHQETRRTRRTAVWPAGQLGVSSFSVQ